MPDDWAQSYRRSAAKRLAQARQASDLQMRASLMLMAQRWLEQAKLIEQSALEQPLRHRAIQCGIGSRLKGLYQPLHCLPPDFIALLSQLDRRDDGRTRPMTLSIREAAEKMRMLAETMTDADAKEALLRAASDYERLA
jgi:hypothetical protein